MRAMPGKSISVLVLFALLGRGGVCARGDADPRPAPTKPAPTPPRRKPAEASPVAPSQPPAQLLPNPRQSGNAQPAASADWKSDWDKTVSRC